MTVYVQGAMLGEGYAGLVPATVTAVHAASFDLLFRDGARAWDWFGKVYDMYEREIPHGDVEIEFAKEGSKEEWAEAGKILMGEQV